MIDRKSFISSMTAAGLGLSIAGKSAFATANRLQETATIGIIGLDTSHSPAFTRIINNSGDDPRFSGFKVVAAYPYGSRNIESSYSRIPGYTEELKEEGVEIVDSIGELLDRVDHVLLLTNDGHPRLEQALQVMETGKRMFMDKPVAGSLKDAIAIFEASKRYNAPAFSTSSLRYITSANKVRNGEIGDVYGADTFSSASREPSHPDLFWYGIHGVEILFTVLGRGCQSVTRTETDKADIVVGTWTDGRAGTFRGIRQGRSGYGGTAYGSDDVLVLGPHEGYERLAVEFIKFFRTGVPPVSLEETLEIYAFMEAADESKRRGWSSVRLDDVIARAK